MKPHEFSIPVHDLDEAGKHFAFEVRRGWMRGALEDTGVSPAGADGSLDVRLSKSGTDVVVRGTLSAEVEAPCARCLEPARIAVHEELSVLMAPASKLRSGEKEELAGEDADMLPYDGETVVLDDLVRGELLLAVPMTPLCSESCPGIRAGG